VDLEDIVHSVTSGLQNCAVAIYNMEDHLIADKIKSLCITSGAMSSRVFMVTSTLRSESKCSFYTMKVEFHLSIISFFFLLHVAA